jgi:hypothetical protein
MDPAMQAYIDGIDPARRVLFDRLHRIALEEHPDATVALSYGMPGYRLGKRRLNLGVWKHGVSVYGWRADHDGGFVARHPTLSSGKATLRISAQQAVSISDDELRALLGGALEP